MEGESNAETPLGGAALKEPRFQLAMVMFEDPINREINVTDSLCKR